MGSRWRANSAIGEPFRFPTRDIGCTVSAMVYGLSMIQKVLTDTGLSDPEIFEAMRFESVDDLLGVLSPEGKVDLTTEAGGYLEDQLKGASPRASLARRLESRGLSGGLGDALWAAQAARRRMQAAASRKAASVAESAAASRGAASGLDWRPRKRVRRAEGYGEADRQLMKKWCHRLAAILEQGNVPSWRQAGAADDPAAAVAGLVGRARPFGLLRNGGRGCLARTHSSGYGDRARHGKRCGKGRRDPSAPRELGRTPPDCFRGHWRRWVATGEGGHAIPSQA